MSAKSKAIVGSLGKFINGGAVGEAPGTALKLPIADMSAGADDSFADDLAVEGEPIALGGRVGEAVGGFEEKT